MHKLMELPYTPTSFSSWLSPESFEYHHGKHHKSYVDKLNTSILEGKLDAEKSLEEIIMTSVGEIYNNAAQVWNHNFFWHGITPTQSKISKDSPLYQAIMKDFRSMEKMNKKFSASAASHFGSGWVWLIKDSAGKLDIITTSDAHNPISTGETPLLTCDLWEHAYYIDHRNAQDKFIEGFFEYINWSFVEANFTRKRQDSIKQ